jgi:hypothetical protein
MYFACATVCVITVHWKEINFLSSYCYFPLSTAIAAATATATTTYATKSALIAQLA